MTNEKTVYVFEIQDTYMEIEDVENFMLYTKKNNLLRPAIDAFERGDNKLFSFQSMVSCLKYNKVSEIITYLPNSETVCSHPYELEDKEIIDECEKEGYWNRFNHQEVDFSNKESEILKKENIKIISLNDEEVSKLEKKLKLHNPI